MTGSFENTTNASDSDEADCLTVMENGEHINGIADDNSDLAVENPVDHNATIETDADAEENVNHWTNKRIKLQTPAFLKPKPVATWQLIPGDDPERTKRLGIESICPNICLYFLDDSCNEGDYCYNSHELPSDDDIQNRLDDRSGQLLRVIVARCPKLLYKYFPVFVDYFADNKMKNVLIESISICQREQDKEKKITFFKHLVRAFIRSGETYETAMEAIFFNLGYIDRDTIDILVNINLVDGISVGEFLSVFRSLKNHRYRFNEHIINRLMLMLRESTQTENVDILNEDILSEFTHLIFLILKSNGHVQSALDRNDYKKFLDLYSRYRNHNRNGNRRTK